MLWPGAGLVVSLLAAPPAAGPSGPPCRDAADCNVAGARALRAGRLDAADEAFAAELRFAWCAGEMAQVVLAHNNLAVLALRRGEALEARLRADVALELDSANAAARGNARRADERAARLPPATGVTGTYWSAAGDPLMNQMLIQEVAGPGIRFEVWAEGAFSCVDMGHHEGGASGRVALTGQEAVWQSQEFGGPCRLRFTFGPDTLTVAQEGSPFDCGFGDRVFADGTYRRVRRLPPHFTIADPKP